MAAKETKKGAARTTRSRAETMQAFEAIREEVEAPPAAVAKSAEAGQLREVEVRRSVEGVTVDNVIQKIAGLGLEVSRALAGISEKLSQEVELLASVREAVALERRELQHLHKIDVAATALDQLVQDYGHEKQKTRERDHDPAQGLEGRDGPVGARAQRAGGSSETTAPA
jgi:colicin import membrane protein